MKNFSFVILIVVRVIPLAILVAVRSMALSVGLRDHLIRLLFVHRTECRHFCIFRVLSLNPFTTLQNPTPQSFYSPSHQQIHH